ncbi:hypothetical protein K1719_045991 [Acacia pycnantha]|nr:hypothetical protein K1719_045991 [Acacia pycnantha]
MLGHHRRMNSDRPKKFVFTPMDWRKVRGSGSTGCCDGREGGGGGTSYRNKLLNLSDGGMERTLVIKLLGRSVTYFDHLNRTRTLWRLKGSFQLIDGEGGFFFATFDLEEDYTKVLIGGPWMIFGAYLIVQPWTIAFDPRTAKLSNAVVWLRISGLSFRYYHKGTLRAIGRLLGEVCHAKDKCSLRTPSATVLAAGSQTSPTDEHSGLTVGETRSTFSGGRLPEPGAAPFGEWMQASGKAPNQEDGGRNNGNKIGSGNGNGIGKNPADLMGKESMSKPTIRRPNPSHSTSKVMVNEYRKKHNHDGPPSTQPVSSSAINSSSSSPTLEPGNITMERSPMEAPLVLSPEQTGIEKTKNNVTPPAIPNQVVSPLATTLDSNNHMVVELRQDRPALTDVEPTRSDSFGDQQRIKKRVGVSRKERRI